jgi:hypothetical protein
MEADFSGWATKAGLLCTDGRTIMPGAFRHQDTMTVPLVWQHGHNSPENVLGHALLEDRGQEGVYAYGFFNDSAQAKHAHGLLEHGDVKHMSIWANQLIEKGKRVLHGAIREVSLVLAGANPGAVIESVTIRHGDGELEAVEDEAIIYTDTELEHGSITEEKEVVDETKEKEAVDETVNHAAGDDATKTKDDDEEGPTVQEVFDSMTDEQKNVVHYMLGVALEEANESEQLQQDSLGTTDDKKEKEDTTMGHNAFEKKDEATSLMSGGGPSISHDDMKAVVEDATRTGSLKEAVEQYAISHGIDDIDVLFPEARALADTPEFDKRRTEWVSVVLNGVRKSPFARIRTVSADLTEEDARAKGYIKGDLKKEEFFAVQKRVTTPTTVYKKQKLDRDDMIDITDFDVVTWLKGEMRLMLDEEIARAVLIGDGRDVAHEDKINEQNIRPIASDHQLYVTTVTVNLDDASSSVREIVDQLILNRRFYKGSGLPTMFTTETIIAQFMLLNDGMDRRLYRSLDELAAELRVAAIVPVEVMEDVPEVVAVLVNLNDYVVGADKGGNVSMFDDFDIDYNQYKYLIETRVSGALVKLKSAIVVRKAGSGSDTAVVPAAPTFDGSAVTIVNTTGVVYKNAETDAVVNNAGSPYAVDEGEVMMVVAEPAAGRFFAVDAGTYWTFRNRA